MELDKKTTGLDRRDFLKGAGVTVLATSGAAILAGCSQQASAEIPSAEPEAPAAQAASVPTGTSELTGWAGTPANIVALGGSTMPLADLNKRRAEYLDMQTDWICEDGTVIPAVYVKLRALIHTYGMGCGNTPYDGAFNDITKKFTEEQAQAFLDMPWGEKFTALDLFNKGGRTFEECEAACKNAADGGYLCCFTNNNGTSYHQVPFFQGAIEYHFTEAVTDPTYVIGIAGTDFLPNDQATTGTPTFYAIPCDKSVVNDGTVLPFDDVEEIFKGKKTAIAPCYCRYTAMAKAGVENMPSFADFATGEFEDYFSTTPKHGDPLEGGLRVETCMMVGDEAEFWISRGWAREITTEDALAKMQRSRDDGFIIESCFSKDTGTICSCYTGYCGIIAEWLSLGSAEAIGAAPAHKSISHYTLEVDFDSCIKCGICSKRCPLHAITMDGEVDGDTGFPKVNEMCFKCGQCAYVCPQSARKLALRPEGEFLELPRDFLDDDNMKAAYRFEQGLIV